MNRFLRTDETEEAVSALEMVTEALVGVEDDHYRWKWAIIALHSAVQGFLVLALRGSAGFDVLTKDEARAWAEAVKRGEPLCLSIEKLTTSITEKLTTPSFSISAVS
ncbi:MAG: hypothetical protein U1F44_00005 [Coriobacteriia bacterium]|nr:hypothetical protein [Coriobacteriia bacterium]